MKSRKVIGNLTNMTNKEFQHFEQSQLLMMLRNSESICDVQDPSKVIAHFQSPIPTVNHKAGHHNTIEW
jgi:hypothetical protein